MITVAIQIRTIAFSHPIQEIDGKHASWEGTFMVDPKKIAEAASKRQGLPLKAPARPAVAAQPPQRDRLGSVLDPNGPAEVMVGLEEKLSGPQGTYSSVTVSIQVKVHCAQTDESVRRASELLYDEGARVLEHHVGPAMELLMMHIRRHGQ